MEKRSNAFQVSAGNKDQRVHFFSEKLRFETDCADVWADMKSEKMDYILVDVRSPKHFKQSHAVQAINLPVTRITEETTAHFTAKTRFVVYCWGPGCNGATKAAIKLSELGFEVKEMIGGIEFWEDRERYPVVRG